MVTETLPRLFVVDGKELADPNPQMKLSEVTNFYSSQYPEMVSSTISGPEIDKERKVAIYTYEKSIGSKG